MSIPGLTIIEDYINEQEEKELLDFIYSQEWSSALSRSVQHYGFEYSYTPPYNVKPAKEIPPLFQKYMHDINPDLNQVIVNEYIPGQGIGKHTDHKLHFGDMIVSLSLGSATTIIFRRGNFSESLYVLPRTLIIMEKEARWEFTHEIPARKSDVVNGEKISRGTRISLTFRTYL